MATMKDAAELAGQLGDLSAELGNELSNGHADFSRMTELAAQIREQADALASTFSTVDEVLGKHVAEVRSRKPARASAGTSED
ncbi:MAG: hypothetical protein M3M94_05105 [Actinomycetota bacterium]|nr:hypothetical protein [Actinomycetota bacterium]